MVFGLVIAQPPSKQFFSHVGIKPGDSRSEVQPSTT